MKNRAGTAVLVQVGEYDYDHEAKYLSSGFVGEDELEGTGIKRADIGKLVSVSMTRSLLEYSRVYRQLEGLLVDTLNGKTSYKVADTQKEFCIKKIKQRVCHKLITTMELQAVNDLKQLIIIRNADKHVKGKVDTAHKHNCASEFTKRISDALNEVHNSEEYKSLLAMEKECASYIGYKTSGGEYKLACEGTMIAYSYIRGNYTLDADTAREYYYSYNSDDVEIAWDELGEVLVLVDGNRGEILSVRSDLYGNNTSSIDFAMGMDIYTYGASDEIDESDGIMIEMFYVDWVE